MRDVIQQVIATEAVAKQMVQSARLGAEQILSEARKRAQELTAVARQEAQLEAQQILATATTGAGRDKQARLASIAAEIEKQVSLDEIVRQQAVAAVVRCVCG